MNCGYIVVAAPIIIPNWLRHPDNVNVPTAGVRFLLDVSRIHSFADKSSEALPTSLGPRNDARLATLNRANTSMNWIQSAPAKWAQTPMRPFSFTCGPHLPG